MKKQTFVINELMKEADEEKQPRGAYLCEYPVFCQFCQIEARRIGRLGIAEYILLLTVRKKDSSPIPSDSAGIEYRVEAVQKVLEESLRSGDVAARYSFNQYIVLLPTCSYESAKMAAERLKEVMVMEHDKKYFRQMASGSALMNMMKRICQDESTASLRRSR